MQPDRHRRLPDRDDKPASLFQAILLATDGTVTDLLSLYTGEKISVHKIDQSVSHETPPAVLECRAGAAILKRRILLRGETRTYLYAESLFVFDRLSLSTQDRLLRTDIPIGLLWKQERLETYREIVSCGKEAGGVAAEYFQVSPTLPFFWRTYVIHHAGRPLGMITEKFPSTYFLDLGKVG